VVAERIPSQLADQTVVLVGVVARMGEDDVGVRPPLESLEPVLDLRALRRKEAVREAADLDLGGDRAASVARHPTRRSQ
jgi:hypothetical protein